MKASETYADPNARKVEKNLKEIGFSQFEIGTLPPLSHYNIYVSNLSRNIDAVLDKSLKCCNCKNCSEELKTAIVHY